MSTQQPLEDVQRGGCGYSKCGQLRVTPRVQILAIVVAQPVTATLWGWGLHVRAIRRMFVVMVDGWRSVTHRRKKANGGVDGGPSEGCLRYNFGGDRLCALAGGAARRLYALLYVRNAPYDLRTHAKHDDC